MKGICYLLQYVCLVDIYIYIYNSDEEFDILYQGEHTRKS